jgi:putative hydrolase of the HAD superfamily
LSIVNRIVAALFDLDDTLVVERASADEAFLACGHLALSRIGVGPSSLMEAVKAEARELWHASPAREYCVRIGISSWEGLWSRFAGDDPDLERLRQWAPRYRRESWSRALDACGYVDGELAEELAERFMTERRKRHAVFPDAGPCLEILGRTMRLGLVTNGVSDLQREKLRGSGFEGAFETVVVSGEIGFGKPDSRIFDAAVQRLGVDARRAVMIGDSLDRDVIGAQRAGLRGVWLNRERKGAPSSAEAPDAEVATLLKVAVAIRSLTDDSKLITR